IICIFGVCVFSGRRSLWCWQTIFLLYYFRTFILSFRGFIWSINWVLCNLIWFIYFIVFLMFWWIYVHGIIISFRLFGFSQGSLHNWLLLWHSMGYFLH